MKKMVSLGCVTSGGLIGAAIGGCILPGIPGILLGGVFGAIFGGIFNVTWTFACPKLEGWMQCDHRDALQVLGFEGCSSWSYVTGARSQETQFVLRVLADPCSKDDVDKVKKKLRKKYQQLALEHHPDKQGGSHDSMVRLGEAFRNLLLVLDWKASHQKNTSHQQYPSDQEYNHQRYRLLENPD